MHDLHHFLSDELLLLILPIVQLDDSLPLRHNFCEQGMALPMPVLVLVILAYFFGVYTINLVWGMGLVLDWLLLWIPLIQF